MAQTLPGFCVESAPVYAEGENAWAVSLRLEIRQSSKFVPAVTRWQLLVDVGYPYGPIEFYPAASGGLTATFQHQELNLALNGPRRRGKLCLKNPYRARLIASRGNDPVGDTDGRLIWYARRAIEWLERAARGDLVDDGDPFEIPRCLATRDPIQVIHCESAASLVTWHNRESSWGRIGWHALQEFTEALLAGRFYNSKGLVIRDDATALHLDDDRRPDGFQGIWWLWPKPIVVAPWQAPRTWSDLREAGKQQGVNVDWTLQRIAAATRGGAQVVLMLGYPISRTWGGPPVEVHWQAVRLGKLERGRVPNGFRMNEYGWWQRDLSTIFKGVALMKYAHTENWHPDRLQSRGRLPDGLCKARVALIGCGALGSILAELLLRAGVRRALLIDGEALASGNLVRHALTAADIGKNKAAALAAMLRAAAPLAEVDAFEGNLPTDPKDVHDLLEDCDIVIDCTASNDVPALLAETWWGIAPLFVSASVGFEARRTFLYRARARTFPVEHFSMQLDPWLESERADWASSEEHLEGAGCYSPIFPARVDDVTMSAIAAVRFIEEAVSKPEIAGEIVVLEKSGLAGLTAASIPRAKPHAAAV